MGKFEDAPKNEWLDDFTSGILYLALYVGDPSDTGIEISGGDYARKSIAASDWNAASAGTLDNANAVTFPQATGTWSAVDVTYFALLTAVTGGNLRSSDEIPAARQQPIVDGNTVEFAAGDIILTIDDVTP